ncbi:MAG: phenylalanine 4-monooxygenase [Acidobacteria bacterium]|nr:phenylalanine 4-monooxygenase [Acidobacteriota bacterium]
MNAVINATIPTKDDFLTEDVDFAEISSLPIDHPGAHDPAYRNRRNYIAELAANYRHDPTHRIPDVDYTREEIEVWRYVFTQLEEVQQRRACSFYLQAKRDLGLHADAIPQLRELSYKLNLFTGFRLAPIEGLVETRAFLTWLEKRTMLCTQYVRHHSRPDYTPEPDIVHEAIGHIPMFTNPDFADFSNMVGYGARIADEQQLIELGRLYWWTVEFGLIEEGSEIKAFGAGLLSSFSELENCFNPNVPKQKFDLRTVINTEFDYSMMQPVLFIIPSYGYLKEITKEFIGSF